MTISIPSAGDGTQSRALLRAVTVLGLGGALACGNPVEPSPPSDSPTDVRVVAVERTDAGNRYQVAWTKPSSSSATSFVIEGGNGQPPTGFVFEVPSSFTEAQITVQVRGPFALRMRSKNSAGSGPPSPEVVVEDIRDMVEALFLATGPLHSPVHQPFCQFTSLFPDVVEGFPRGTTVTVTMSTTLAEQHRSAIETFLDDLTAATGGAFQAVRVSSTDRAYLENAFRMNRFHGANEIVVLDVDDGGAFCGALGCGGGRVAQPPVEPLFRNGFVMVQRDAPASIAIHELGHAVGLCHDAPAIMGLPTLMGTATEARISMPELAAIRTLYGRGFGPGTTRAELLSRDLVNPLSATPSPMSIR